MVIDMTCWELQLYNTLVADNIENIYQAMVVELKKHMGYYLNYYDQLYELIVVHTALLWRL